MKPTIKYDRAYAYVRIVALAAIFMVLSAAAVHGQDLPNAPQVAIKHQLPSVNTQRALLAKPGSPDLGSADWFRERGCFRLAKFIPVLKHINWHFGNDKSKEASHGSRKSR